MIKKFAAACAEDDRVVSAFVGGSFATGTTDERSDLDLYAVIRADAYDHFLEQHRAFFERWADPVFLEPFDGFGFDMLIFILDGGLEGELAIAKDDNFLHIHGGPYRALIDRSGLLEGVEFPWHGPTHDEQLRVLTRHINWFWRDLSLLSTAMARGQRWTAYGYLESMRRRCINLIRIDRDFGSWPDGYEKLESVVGDEDLAHLARSFSSLDEAAILNSVKVLISFYREIAPRLALQHGIEYPKPVEEVVLKREAHLLTEGREQSG